MQLILDMGNSTIVAALMQNGKVMHSTRIPSDRNKPQEFFEKEFAHHLLCHMQPGERIERCALSSVVPELNERICAAATAVTHQPVTIVTTELIEQLLHIDVDEPRAVGKDRLCDCIGALAVKSGLSGTYIVIDMGTATTVNVVMAKADAAATFLGGMIIPGVRTSLISLSNKASQLSEVRIQAPPTIIGRNTTHCMQSGIVFGYAAMIDGVIERILAELRNLGIAELRSCGDTELCIIATGGMAQKIVPHCQHQIQCDEHLLLKGISAIVNFI